VFGQGDWRAKGGSVGADEFADGRADADGERDALAPPEIVGEDEPSAKAFVRYWFATLSTAMAQGDIESLRQVSGASCVTCRRWVTTIEGVFDSGGRYVTKGWKIQHLVGEPASGQTPVTYLITVREQRRSLLDADGRVVDVSPPTIRAMRMILRRDGDHWVARRLDVIE
jgi:hypothetical protein